MKAPQSEALRLLLQDVQSADCYFKAKREAIRRGHPMQIDRGDIKYLGVPNICFSLTSAHDSREEKFKEQRKKRGFDDSELWSLRDTIANFIIPRLEAYIDKSEETFVIGKKRRKDTKNLLEALKLIARDSGAAIFTKKEEKKVEKGLKAFPKVFMRLWI